MQSIAPSELWLDTGIEDPQAERLYRAKYLADGVRGFDAITDAEIASFHDTGFLVVNEAFTPEEVQAALDGMMDLIDGVYPEFHGIQFEAKAKDLLPTMSPEQKQDVVRKLMSFVEYDSRMKAMSAHPALLSVISRMMGETPEIFQDMALIKPPLIGREKPWHQDIAFFALPGSATVVGVWIALDEALIVNGCMHVIAGSHLAGPIPHFQRRDWQICDSDVSEDVVAVPLKPGGCLFFHGLIHHGTPPSHSSLRRRAVQFHYKPASVAYTSEEERLALFGSEGKDVTC